METSLKASCFDNTVHLILDKVTRLILTRGDTRSDPNGNCSRRILSSFCLLYALLTM